MGLESPSPLPLARITVWLSRQVELALVEVDLSLPQYRILHLLNEGIALPSSLAERLDVRRPSITAVVDGLVARELVVRETGAADRRQVTHRITKAGSRLLATADTVIEARLGLVASALNDPAAEQAAMDGLGRWGPALVAWHEQRHAAHIAGATDGTHGHPAAPATAGVPTTASAPAGVSS